MHVYLGGGETDIDNYKTSRKENNTGYQRCMYTWVGGKQVLITTKQGRKITRAIKDACIPGWGGNKISIITKQAGRNRKENNTGYQKIEKFPKTETVLGEKGTWSFC